MLTRTIELRRLVAGATLTAVTVIAGGEYGVRRSWPRRGTVGYPTRNP